MERLHGVWWTENSPPSKPRMSLVLGGFAKALIEVAELGTVGLAKHEEGSWRGYTQEALMDKVLRHLFAALSGEEYDAETGKRHMTAVAWNALAVVQNALEEEPPEARED